MDKATLNNMNHAQLLAVAVNIGADLGVFYDIPLISDNMLRKSILRRISHDVVMACVDSPDGKKVTV